MPPSSKPIWGPAVPLLEIANLRSGYGDVRIVEGVSLAGLLVDWLYASFVAAPARPELARALLEALEWQLALAASGVHPYLRDEAMAELQELRESLDQHMEKADRDRVAALIQAAN